VRIQEDRLLFLLKIAAKSKEAGMMGLERARKTASFQKAMKKVKKIKDALERSKRRGMSGVFVERILF
jgi:hypothetical protein